MKRIQSATVPGSLSGGFFSGRTGILQTLLDGACALPAAFSEPVSGLPEKNLCPLFPLLRLLLLADEIARQKTDNDGAQKDYEPIVLQILFPAAHSTRRLGTSF